MTQAQAAVKTGPASWDFRRCLGVSLAAHALLLLVARGLPSMPAPPPVEVEITSPFLGTGPAHLAAPKAKVEGAKGIPLPPAPNEAKVAPKVAEPQKDWVAPAPGVKATEKPQENTPNPTGAENVPKNAAPPTPGGVTGATGISPLPGGSGAGAPYGTPNGTGDGGAPLTAMPRLLNLDEILANLRKYYPESERRAGHEGDVLVKVHIGADGLVGDVEVVHADSEAFGVAAQKVGRLMRFSPAMKISGPVPAAISVPMQFRLKD